MQVTPFPWYPELQAHVRLPIVLEQVALASQPPLFARHSFTSENQIYQFSTAVINKIETCRGIIGWGNLW